MQRRKNILTDRNEETDTKIKRERERERERERQKRQMNCYGSKRLLNLTEIDKVRCH